jgi:hypothetical protein
MDKQKLISLAEELLKEEDLSKRAEDLLYLKRQYKFLQNKEEETYYERQLTDRFNALYEELAKKEPKLNQSSYQEKKEIIGLAKKLLDRNDILKASKDLDNLLLSFKKAGRSSKEQDDELYAEFKEVKDQFYAKKKAYFEELDKNNAEKTGKKREIIEKAKGLLDIKNIKESNEKMDALMEEWKAVGYAGKEDEKLWQEFSAVRKEFNTKKKERHAEVQKLFVSRAEQKEELIKEMKKLLADSDFSDEELKKVKDLRKKFNDIGFAGKEKDDELYAQFNELVKKYFDEKKFYTI